MAEPYTAEQVADLFDVPEYLVTGTPEAAERDAAKPPKDPGPFDDEDS